MTMNPTTERRRMRAEFARLLDTQRAGWLDLAAILTGPDPDTAQVLAEAAVALKRAGERLTTNGE